MTFLYLGLFFLVQMLYMLYRINVSYSFLMKELNKIGWHNEQQYYNCKHKKIIPSYINPTIYDGVYTIMIKQWWRWPLSKYKKTNL